MLEAFAAQFAGVFAAIYDAGTLHRAVRTDADDGDVSVAWTDVEIKGQVDQISETMRASAGYTAKEQRLIILQAGVNRISTDDEITLGGTRWKVSAVETDPLNTHFIVRGERA